MEVRNTIIKTILSTVAEVFSMDEEALKQNMDIKLIEDLGATSVQFFPIIAALEEELDIEIQYQDFRREAKTINKAIDFVETEYVKTYGE